ncbi:hypothetical protein H5J22_11345 [Cetobacterium sp. 8H]|uniref:hypothetical protein n=1 Tax=Cetobacterium sp. 8H TaxID=2759681 RepID=UPI00163C0A46|nr:hypothetical protein [Cetobacterium sp. 8H]MBC2851991.1 hypothetical protein [Cetobacterium sp. 8H]
MKNRIENRLLRVLENSEILDKRAYLTIDGDGSVERKEMNLTIPAMVFCADEVIFDETLEKESDKREREKEKKIERLSNLTVEKLKENFTKLVVKGEVEFAKRYGKELALREAEEFNKTLFNLSLMDNISFKKPLMALAMKEILDTVGWNDKIGYLVISYFTKQRYDLSSLEAAVEVENKDFDIPEILELVAYKKVLNMYDYKNEKKYASMLSKWKNDVEELSISPVENEMLKTIKF